MFKKTADLVEDGSPKRLLLNKVFKLVRIMVQKVLGQGESTWVFGKTVERIISPPEI